jgi:hypothetical protein
MFRLIRRAASLARMLPTLDLSWEQKAALRKRNRSSLCELVRILFLQAHREITARRASRHERNKNTHLFVIADK